MATDSDDLVLERPERVRRTGSPDTHGKKHYEAFDTRGKAFPYLEIRCVGKPSHAPQYRGFVDVIFSADFDKTFTLLYQFMGVEVTGRKLSTVRRAIQCGHCEFIQEFDGGKHQEPLPDKPVITSINFIPGEKLADILSTYHKKPQE